ncbi:MAG: hypothetical protein OXU20_27275, partial [Myxococcales bacterium]|nr:hypothetical protein [Myxococcales bacterium]
MTVYTHAKCRWLPPQRRWSLPALLTLALACSANTSHTANGSETQDAAAPPSDVTWHQDIAPMFAENCGACHQVGGIAPFPLQTYEQAKPLAELIRASVMAGTMPPFLAKDTDDCAPQYPFRYDPSLSDEQKALVDRWVTDGSPQGEPENIPSPPPLAGELDRVDLSLTITSPVEVIGGADVFTCFILDPQLEEDMWIDAAQVVPGNTEIVHHVVVYEDVQNSLSPEQIAAGRYDCFG